MVNAPRPGVTRREEAKSDAQKVMKITVRGETRTLAVGNIPLKERLVVRKATGYPVEQFLDEDHFGLDSLQIVWWLAGRANGSPFLTLMRVEEDWPDDLDIETELTVEVDDPDGEDDDPEA